MSEEGGLGALLGAYNSDSDSQDQKSTGNEGRDIQAEDPHDADAPDAEKQAQEATDMLLDNQAETAAVEIPDAPEEGPQRPPPMDPEAAYGYAEVDIQIDNNEHEDRVPTTRIAPFDALPPELAFSPSGECNPEVQARVARWLELQRDGRRLTDTLRSSRDYRNPEFFKKMVEYWEIDEHGTAFAPEMFNPGSLPEEDCIEALKKRWTEEEERKKMARKTGTAKIEFTQASGGAGGGNNAAATATATAAAIKAAQAMAAKLAANRGQRR